MASRTCPACKVHHIHRSHSHSILEQIRKGFTTKRLYRCHHCGWRGWLESGQRVSELNKQDSQLSNRYLVFIIALAVAVGILVMFYLTRMGEGE